MKYQIEIDAETLDSIIKNELKEHYGWAAESGDEPTLIEALRIVHNYFCFPSSDEVIK